MSVFLLEKHIDFELHILSYSKVSVPNKIGLSSHNSMLQSLLFLETPVTKNSFSIAKAFTLSKVSTDNVHPLCLQSPLTITL